MNITNRCQALLLCGTLAAFIGAAQAGSPEDAVTKMDEAAEAEAKKAEEVMQSKVEKMEKDAEIDKSWTRGEPMQEAEIGGVGD